MFVENKPVKGMKSDRDHSCSGTGNGSKGSYMNTSTDVSKPGISRTVSKKSQQVEVHGEPLLDYEDYIKEEEILVKKAKKEICSTKGKKKPSSKGKASVPKSQTLADQIGNQIARIRAYTSWRKPRDTREQSRQHVQTSRARNKDKLLYSRRCGADREDRGHLDKWTEFPVGETDPKMHEVIWRFQKLTFVDASFPDPWKLSRDRKRGAPSVDRVPHYNPPEAKRRKI